MIVFKAGKINSDRGFSFVELMIVAVLMIMIIGAAFKVFFSQAKVVTKSIGALQVNEGFRKIMAFLGDDIKEATDIIEPVPIFMNKISELKTKTGVVLRLLGKELDPGIPFNSPLGGQISLIREVVYRIEEMEKDKQNPSDFPLYRLRRIAVVREKPGESPEEQGQVLVENIREIIIYRTVRKPFQWKNIKSKKDRLVNPLPISETGTGNSLVHLKMTLERERIKENGEVYQISLNTSFYKRGKEVFVNQ
jgi:hypothetical protein